MVTLAEIAARAGVSTYTVSAALSGRGRVGRETAERVRKLAKEMGYRRDSVASLMARMGRRGRGAERQVQIGLLDFSADKQWEPAIDTGFTYQRLSFPPKKQLASSLKQWWHQGIDGLVINTRPGGERELLEHINRRHPHAFDPFCIVTIGPSRFCHVRDSAVRMMDETLRKVITKGHRKIAVLLGENDQTEDWRARLGAVLLAREEIVDGVQLTWHRCRLPLKELPAAATRWLRSEQPEALITFPGGTYWALREAGFQMPEDFTFYGVPLNSSFPDHLYPPPAGMWVKDSDYQTAAVELMDQLLRLRLHGIPEHLLVRVIEGEWREAAPA